MWLCCVIEDREREWGERESICLENAHHKKFASKSKVKLHEDMIHSST